MRYTFSAILAAAFLLLIAPETPVSAEPAELTQAQRDWLDGIATAPWTAESGANGVTISACNAPVFSAHLKPVMALTRNPNPPDVSALDAIVRIEVPEAGWLEWGPVEKGTYTIGLMQKAHGLVLVTRDEKGVLVDIEGMYLNEPTDSLPSTMGMGAGGKVNVVAEWGGVSFSWTFVSRARHDEVAGELREATSGNVTILSDLPETARLEDLAKQAAQAQPVNAALFGQKLADGTQLRVYILSDVKRHDALNQIAADGQHVTQLGYTSKRTGWSYIRYYLKHEPSAFDGGMPASVRDAVIHEMHHQYAYHVSKGWRVAPLWLQEGLAELATARGLTAVDKPLGAAFEDMQRTGLAMAAAWATLPAAEDLFGWNAGAELKPLYFAAWAVAKELAAKKGRVEAIVQAVSEHYLGSGAEQAARREFDRTGIDVAQVLAREAAGKTTGAREIFGVADRAGSEWRVVSGRESAGLAILPQRAKGVTLTFSGEFRWHHELGEQVDLVVAFGEGARSRRFVKLAVLPAKVVLFALEGTEWRTLTSYEYDSPLERGTAEKPVWHPFKINFDGPAETLRFETTNGRWTNFTLNEYFSIPNTHCGIGCYDGVAYFRNLKIAD